MMIFLMCPHSIYDNSDDNSIYICDDSDERDAQPLIQNVTVTQKNDRPFFI